MNRCDEVKAWIHERLDRDEDPMSVSAEAALEHHRATCDACAEYVRSLQALRRSLRSLPAIEMPDDAFQHVLDRTVRAEGARVAAELRNRPAAAPAGSSWTPAAWWAVAAAALAVAAALTFLPRDGAAPNGAAVAETYSAEEVENASRQMRLALGLTGRALKTGREAAADDVRELDRTLERLPIRLPLSRRRQPETRGEL